VEKDVHASAIAAARPDEIMRAFLHSCDGRWVRTSRLLWLQLANEETTLRMQRYLRQPLSALAGIVGTRGVDTKRTVIDPFGDALLTGYKAKEDAEHLNTHNALCRLLSTCLPGAYPERAGRREGPRHQEEAWRPTPGRRRWSARLGTCAQP